MVKLPPNDRKDGLAMFDEAIVGAALDAAERAARHMGTEDLQAVIEGWMGKEPDPDTIWAELDVISDAFCELIGVAASQHELSERGYELIAGGE